MPDFTTLEEQITDSITTNGTGDITGAILRGVLLDIVEDIADVLLDCVTVLEDGLYVTDEDMNVVVSITEDGLDAALVADHLKSLIATE